MPDAEDTRDDEREFDVKTLKAPKKEKKVSKKSKVEEDLKAKLTELQGS